MNLYLTPNDRERLKELESKSRFRRWLNRKLCYHELKTDWDYGNMIVNVCTRCGKHIVEDKAESDLKAK